MNEVARSLELGAYPTPVECLHLAGQAGGSLWVKRDDLTHPVYGGNKVRKLERLLADALASGATRLATIGAVGSHHVLATGFFGAELGLPVQAAVLAQPRSTHVMETLRATLAQGVQLLPFDSYAAAARQLKAWTALGAYVIPAGGSSLLGTLGIVAGAVELAEQVCARQLPEPDWVVAPLGSGGTVAGLVAGLIDSGMKTRVLGVSVSQPSAFFANRARLLAERLLRPSLHAALAQRLVIESGYLGSGYGVPTAAGAQAIEEGRKLGLVLDQTYTAKAFAVALERVRRRSDETILYWQTLSSAPLEPLLRGASLETELAPELLRLAR